MLAGAETAHRPHGSVVPRIGKRERALAAGASSQGPLLAFAVCATPCCAMTFESRPGVWLLLGLVIALFCIVWTLRWACCCCGGRGRSARRLQPGDWELPDHRRRVAGEFSVTGHASCDSRRTGTAAVSSLLAMAKCCGPACVYSPADAMLCHRQSPRRSPPQPQARATILQATDGGHCGLRRRQLPQRTVDLVRCLTGTDGSRISLRRR